MKATFFRCWVGLILCLAAISGARAQDAADNQKKCHFLLQRYFMFPVMEGQIGLGELPDADIQANASDVFSNLQFGTMLYFEAYTEHWALNSDVIYMHISEDIEGVGGIVSGEAGAQLFLWEVAVLRKLKPWFEAGIGLRRVNVNSSLDMLLGNSIPGTGGQCSGSISETWIDPIIVGRMKYPAGKKWLFQLRGDIGGFGVGSEFAWQIQGDVSYRFSRLFQLGLSDRTIGMAYENGSGKERFVYNVTTYGPALKFGFNF